MSTLTLAFYLAAAGFLAVMLIEPVLRFLRFARRYRVVCPDGEKPATVWATPLGDAPGGGALRLDGCSRLEPGHTCDKTCIESLK